MKRHLSVAAAAVALLCCAACGSHNNDNAYGSGHDTEPGYASSGSHSGSSSSTGTGSQTGSAPAGGHDSEFCQLVRKAGADQLGVSEATLADDPNKLLALVDQLDKLAPADLRTDFDTFTKFEHAVLNDDPSAFQPGADDQAALHHVAAYFTDTCGINE